MYRKKEPLYKFVYNDIYEKINSGYYQTDQMIPTEKELQEYYNVSRVTIRKATDKLVEDNYLQRTAGYGTIVCSKVLSRKPVDQKGFSEEMQSMGRSSSTKVIDFRIMPANTYIASILGIEPSSMVYHFHRLRYGDDDVLQFEETYMSCELFPDLSLNQLEKSKFEFVESKGYSIDMAIHKTVPVLPNQQIARYFNISLNTPIIKITNTTFLKNGKVMDLTEQYMNSSKYQLQYIRKR